MSEERVADAFLVEWKLNGETWVEAHCDEPRARDQARRKWGTCTPLFRQDPGVIADARKQAFIEAAHVARCYALELKERSARTGAANQPLSSYSDFERGVGAENVAARLHGHAYDGEAPQAVVLGGEQRTIAERTQAEMNDVAEAEREACIRILEDLRPTNDRSDWTEWALIRDDVLRSAICRINARYPS